MAQFDLALPKFGAGDLDDEKQRRKIMNYLVKLDEQLRFVLNNLDTENFTETFQQVIVSGGGGGSGESSESLKALEEEINRLSTKVTQTANEIALKASAEELNELGDLMRSLNAEFKVLAGEISTKVSKEEYDALGNTVSQHSTAITQTAEKIESTAKAVETLDGKVEEQSTRITQTAEKIESKAEKSVVDALGNTVSKHSTAITQTAEKIESKAEASVVNALGETVAKHESAISQTPEEIRLAVESVQIGGRNYILGTAEPYTAVGTGSRQWLFPWHCASIAANKSLYGKTVTISFDYEEAITSGSFYIHVSGLWIGVKSFDSDTGSGHFTLTREYADFEADDDVFIYIDGTWTGSVTFSNVKVEIGNKETDWTPAPEDTDAELEAVRNAVQEITPEYIVQEVRKSDAYKNDLSSLKVSSDEIIATVTSSETYKGTIDTLQTQITANSDSIMLQASKTIGGRNYILGTGTPYTAVGTGTGQWLYPWHCASSEAANRLFGNTVTISFDYDAAITSGSLLVQTNMLWWGVKSFGVGTESNHFSLTRKYDAAITADDVFIYIDGTWTGSVTFRNLKVEIGDTATDWTPAPEDAAKSVDTGGAVRIDQTGVHMSGGTIEMETADGDEYIHIRNDGISASSLSAPDVTPRYGGPGTLYVNPNATSEQIAKGDTFRSLADAFGKLNGHYISGEITVFCASGAALYGALELADVVGGKLIIVGNGATLYGALTLNRNSCAVQINGLNASVSSGNALTATNCGYVGMWANTLNSSAGTAIVMTGGGQFYATGCTLIGGGGMAASITTATLAVFIDCIGTGKIVVQYAALTAGGTVPLGGAENWGASLFNASGVTPTGADGTPAAPVISTAVYDLMHADSYAAGNVNSWVYPEGKPNDDIYQGYTGQAGRICGCMWFDNAAIRNALSGKTIKQASIRLTAQRYVGYGREVTVYLRGTATSYSGRSGPPALTTDYGMIGTAEPAVTGTFTIPAQAISDIASGAIEGLVLYHQDTADMQGKNYSRNYMRFDGSTSGDAETRPRLTVVYQ